LLTNPIKWVGNFTVMRRNGKMRTALIIVVCTLLSGHLTAQRFTNKGKEFWVGYGYNWLFFNNNAAGVQNSQEMVLYLSADQEANVTVSIPGTSYTKQYHVPANTAIKTELIPKSGANDCRINNEGLFTKNVHVVSDVPIVVFEHTYGNFSSGATMLFPVEAYGYTYYSHNAKQATSAGYHSWFYVVASEDGTTVAITPKFRTVTGKLARQPFQVNLKKGEVYNVMGEDFGGVDMSGSKIQSVPGTDGFCHPIAVFSGTARTSLELPDLAIGLGGSDFMMVQAFPVSAWGMKYVTAATSSSLDASKAKENTFRVFVTDPSTQVTKNGLLLTSGLKQSSYYEYKSTGADYITADKPIMVVQIIHSQDAPPMTPGELQDPEMFFLSPLEQAIDQVIFFNNNTEAISVNYLTLIIPEAGMSSLRIDGGNAFDYTYPHPNLPGYRVVVKNMSTAVRQHSIVSNEHFMAITYGLGSYESYGYNVGAYISNLAAIPEIKPVNSNETYNYVCTKTPFKFSLKTIYQPTGITLFFSKLPHATPANDVTINAPVPSGTSVINGVTYYSYDLPDEYEFSVSGEYTLPVYVTDPSIDNCSQSQILLVAIPVYQGPSADFSVNSVCVTDSARFTYIPISTDAHLVKWNFGDGTGDTKENPAKKYATGGIYNARLHIKRELDGCLGDTIKPLVIRSLPTVDFVLPATICMPGGQGTFTDKTAPGDVTTPGPASYKWGFGDGGASTDKNPEHGYASAAAYTVKLIVSRDGCSDSVSKVLPATAFVATPVADFSAADTAFCVQATAQFYDKSKIGNPSGTITWKWDFGNGQIKTDKNPSVLFANSGKTQVTLTVTNDGCTSIPVSKPVPVYAAPGVDAGNDVRIGLGESTMLNGVTTGETVSVKWSPFVYLSQESNNNPVATPPADQLYYFTATGRAGCKSYDSVWVRVFADIKIPNAFSPNSDGINDRWEIPSLAAYTKADIDIYNRWGQLVYKSRGYSTPWDGNSNGKPLPGGTYYYIIRPNANNMDMLKGAILIIR
jgi:gliding motility-associated-like protein